MTVSVYLSPSIPEDHEPGHMCLAWQKEKEAVEFRGYVFKVLDLPAEYQSVTKWREYVFDHVVPGYVIVDEIMIEKHACGDANLIARHWPANPWHIEELAEKAKPGPRGVYSFNPDDHPGAHNCVTWVTEVVNQVLGVVLPKVRQGRIKLMTEVLKTFRQE